MTQDQKLPFTTIYLSVGSVSQQGHGESTSYTTVNRDGFYGSGDPKPAFFDLDEAIKYYGIKDRFSPNILEQLLLPIKVYSTAEAARKAKAYRLSPIMGLEDAKIAIDAIKEACVNETLKPFIGMRVVFLSLETQGGTQIVRHSEAIIADLETYDRRSSLATLAFPSSSSEHESVTITTVRAVLLHNPDVSIVTLCAEKDSDDIINTLRKSQIYFKSMWVGKKP